MLTNDTTQQAMHARLKDFCESTPWPERLDEALAILTLFRERRYSAEAVEFANLLADDPKWEVRKVIAESLPFVPDNVFPKLAARLTEDSNAFVRHAAERAMDQRERERRLARREKRDLEQVVNDFQAFEKQFGKLAATRARHIGERMYERLIKTVVHDTRNLMTPLKEGLRRLLKCVSTGKADPVAMRSDLRKMGDRLNFLQRLFDDMVTFTQQLPTERRRVLLSDIFADAIGLVEENFQAKGIDIQPVAFTAKAPKLASLMIARHLIVTAVCNVLNNAFEAFLDREGKLREGQITMTGKVVDDRIVIVIHDNGPGMNQEDMDLLRLFAPGLTTKKSYGTGFGLPIAHRNIRAHGGTLDVESRAGQGMTVTINLPKEISEDDNDEPESTCD